VIANALVAVCEDKIGERARMGELDVTRDFDVPSGTNSPVIISSRYPGFESMHHPNGSIEAIFWT